MNLTNFDYPKVVFYNLIDLHKTALVSKAEQENFSDRIDS